MHILRSYRGKTCDVPPKAIPSPENVHNQNEISTVIFKCNSSKKLTKLKQIVSIFLFTSVNCSPFAILVKCSRFESDKQLHRRVLISSEMPRNQLRNIYFPKRFWGHTTRPPAVGMY